MKRKYPKYLDWVRSLPCGICGPMQRTKTEAHHLKGEFHQSGAALKAPDYLAMALCSDCHRDMHSGKQGWSLAQREALIRTLIAAFECGMIQVAGYDDVDPPLPTRPLETKDGK